MVSFPNAKINIGLRILGKRPDGYHELQSLFYPIVLKDVLEVIPHQSEEILFSQSGLTVKGNPSDNLCIKAYHLIRSAYPHISGIAVHLLKHIPMGAGLGGGSADGSFMIEILNQLFGLKMTLEEKLSFASKLGSDCPFFIHNRPCLVSGRGEIITPFEQSLTDYSIFLIHPGIHINTAWAFRSLSTFSEPTDLTSILTQPVISWREWLFNDFEKAVFEAYPEIGSIKKQLYECGAHYASLSGSGSTVYGIFPKNMLPSIEFPANYFTIWV